MKPQAKRIFWNAMLLTASTLFVRTVGVSFQVYISNQAGAEAMGLFSLMSGVYGFALTLATSGIHLGVTHVVVDAIGRGRPDRVRVLMLRATAYALFFGGLASVLLAGFAEPIGLVWLKDARTVSSLRLFALTLPLIALSSALGGYFTAVKRTYKTAAVQVLEQAAKIGATMYLLAAWLPKDIETTCVALVLGGASAEILSFLFELVLFLFDRRRHRTRAVGEKDGQTSEKSLLGVALPVAFTAYARSGLLTLEHILIPEGLRNSGASHAAALASYGVINGMAIPIILYPASLIASFSGLLVPELAESRVQGYSRRIGYIVSRVWALALLFSIAAAGILICFSEEIGGALYPATETGYYIRLLAPLIPIMYVDTATDAMLKGLGEQVFSMNINLIDALISVILVWLLVPRFGITGYLATIYFSELFNTVLSITRLLTVCHIKPRTVKWVYKPLLAIVGATCIMRAVLELSAWTIDHAACSIVVHCLAVLLLYLLLLRLLGGIDREDLSWIASLFGRRSEPPAVKQRQAAKGSRQRKSLRNCFPENAACRVGVSKEKSATSECGFFSGSS